MNELNTHDCGSRLSAFKLKGSLSLHAASYNRAGNMASVICSSTATTCSSDVSSDCDMVDHAIQVQSFW